MSDEHLIHIVKFSPDTPPIGHVHLLHGMEEHISRYEDFATFLMSKGFVVTGHDHRGHGLTAEKNGQFGYFADKLGFERVTEDVREVLLHVRENLGDSPLILFGHSMGSFVARRYMQKYSDSLNEVVLSGTTFSPGVMGGAGKLISKFTSAVKSPKAKATLINNMTFGGFNKQISNPKTPFDWLSTDEKEVQKYIDDPHCGIIPTNLFFIDLFDGLKIIHQTKKNNHIKKDLPVLVISGAKDPVGKQGKDIFKVANGLKSVGMTNVTVHLVQDARHEILNEVNKLQTYEIIANWMIDNA
ncbi:Lysophospholipase, alpha-beta hydrolase superfamily [Psychrobacillus sp. OK028]|uniref:alpha/beta fold hydrolase n=1 Tax=Psychrobacillus sp. OK028 TaxID=1884359 RepID=UPI00087ECC22|nr:alpha/beta hydrolase [Psychrobacillus sp. OK028]SDO24714.1 Lysophospholipase, alpha-beta hydrolase superfamily [Psychrobacillus sp. OK028]